MEFARVVETGRKPGVSEVVGKYEIAVSAGIRIRVIARILREWIRPEVKAVH